MLKRRNKYVSWEYPNDAVVIPTKIVSVVDVIEYSEIKVKTVFDCESQSGVPQRCICWERLSISVGDEVQLTGRFKDKIFIAWKVLITKRGEKKDENFKNENVG
ncbi:MAG: hypothetical protein PHV37_09140 [Candidatus Gastranaerophilales bacterium]|nr:hypothetical protein [Candidatus Gastranaerophilales bacterium]